MHTRDAKTFKLNAGDRVAIETDSGKLELALRVADNMATGILLVPRHHRLEWQIFGTGSVSISRDQIKKVAS